MYISVCHIYDLGFAHIPHAPLFLANVKHNMIGTFALKNVLKKNKTNELTDMSETIYSPQLVAWCIIKLTGISQYYKVFYYSNRSLSLSHLNIKTYQLKSIWIFYSYLYLVLIIEQKAARATLVYRNMCNCKNISWVNVIENAVKLRFADDWVSRFLFSLLML